MSWYLGVLKKYAVFSGRARRKEYWMFSLFNFIFTLIAVILDTALSTGGVVYVLYYLGILLPTLAVTVRRLHDVGKSGWFIFIGLIPIIGAIWLLILTLSEGKPGYNKYGPNPKEVVNESEAPRN